MDTSYDKVISYLTEEQGLSLKEAEEIMVLCIEQGMNPVEIFGRGLVDMLNLLPKKKKVEPAKPQPTGTPRQGNLLTKTGQAQNFTRGRTPFTSTSPVPAASSPLPKPPTKPAVSPGQMNLPGLSNRAQELRNVTRNPNTGMPGGSNAGLSMSGGTNAPRNQSIFRAQPTRTAPALPKPPSAATLSRGARLLKGLKGPLAVGAEIAADATLTPVAKAAGTELGKALTRGVASATGTTDKVRTRLPSYYGAKGPDLTRDIVQGVKSREPKTGMSNIPPAEGPVNNPNFGKKPAPVKPAPAAKLSAAAKDFDRTFAAKRAAGEKEFTWRGKKYTTKLKGE
jgi:hypothetical protein